MFRKLECVAIYTEDIEKSIEFYVSLGMTKIWEADQDERGWKLVGLGFPSGESQLVLKNNPELKFPETEIVVDDVRNLYETLKHRQDVTWIRTPFANPLGGHVAVMEVPDGNVFVLVGK